MRRHTFGAISGFLVSVVGVGYGAIHGSETIIQASCSLMSALGLSLTLFSYARRRQVRLAQKDLAEMEKLPNIDRNRAFSQKLGLENRLQDGIFEGLILAGIGSIVAGLARPLIFVFTGV